MVALIEIAVEYVGRSIAARDAARKLPRGAELANCCIGNRVLPHKLRKAAAIALHHGLQGCFGAMPSAPLCWRRGDGDEGCAWQTGSRSGGDRRGWRICRMVA